MRKLKLQVQMTIDGFISGVHGESDWMSKNWDDEFRKYEYDLATSSDTLLMGRKMTNDFISHWEDVAKNQPDNDWHSFAREMVKIKKLVFSKSVKSIKGENLRVENGDLPSIVKSLKGESGKDLLVYGGANFVSSLLKERLVDEMYLFVNPAIIGQGKAIFKEITTMQQFKLVSSKQFDCGVIVMVYKLV